MLLLSLAAVGVVIIICCIILFFTRVEIKDKIQEIKMLGAEMKISVITFFVFVGLILIVPILYTNYRAVITDVALLNKEHENTVTELKAQIEELRKTQTRTVTLYLDLEKTSEDRFPSKDQLSVGYTKPGIGSDQLQTLNHFVDFFQGHRRVGVRIEDVKPETEFSSIEVVNKQSNERWIIEGVKPFLPVITLKKQGK
jgi:hypothetical protein